jgi:hypothetical protein
MHGGSSSKDMQMLLRQSFLCKLKQHCGLLQNLHLTFRSTETACASGVEEIHLTINIT